MSKTNCINCGAAKDIDELKCPFCGTTYLDFTAIDFSSDDPVVCQFVMPFSCETVNSPCKLERHGKTVMSMLAIPKLNEITTESTSVCFDDGFSFANRYTNSYEMNIGISFKPVARRYDNTLFSLKTEP